jgi:hypothetical protein
MQMSTMSSWQAKTHRKGNHRRIQSIGILIVWGYKENL